MISTLNLASSTQAHETFDKPVILCQKKSLNLQNVSVLKTEVAASFQTLLFINKPIGVTFQ